MGEKIENNGIIIQQIGNYDSYIGKHIKTEQDFFVTIDDLKGHQSLNVKNKIIIIDDIVRSCGLYLYCKLMDNKYFALSPEDLKDFIEVELNQIY